MSYPRPAAWLSRSRIAWVINSSSSSVSDRVHVRAHARRWVPAWLVRYAVGAYFGHLYASRADTCRVQSLSRSKPTAAGLIRWEAVYSPARPQVIWRHG